LRTATSSFSTAFAAYIRDRASAQLNAGHYIPVVFLTGRALAANETLAFDGARWISWTGARMANLVRRLRVAVRAKMREPEREQSSALRPPGLKPQISRALWDDVDLDLTVGEFKIVTCSSQCRPPRLLSRTSTTPFLSRVHRRSRRGRLQSQCQVGDKANSQQVPYA